ncbi:lysine--tRNA ligase [Halobacteriales archaeon QS_5_70_17]|nr:MAG: lysine--tRNA ligase [Halobacteriales archaeon QS_5_70_17]
MSADDETESAVAVDPLTAGGENRDDGDRPRRAFWADAVADEIEARDPEEPIVVKGGVSPSGVPHIGHLNEVMRGYLVAEALRERGREVRQVFTADDRDPLRAVPRTLATLDWEVVSLGDTENPGALGRNLGRPLTDVPDPFGCCDSFGAHQTHLLQRMADAVGVPVEVVSNTDLYEDGGFEEVTRDLLADRERAREVLAEYQASVDPDGDYVPFTPICDSCGKLTGRVVAVDLDGGTVDYVCEDSEAGNRTIEGCGREGTATLREGKLPWRFEWPAQWRVLGVDFEPFGKDHAEGSWPSGEHVSREVLGFEPPVPMVYEWFTYNGEALSSSSGHVVTVDDVLSMLEREVFRYFFTKPPKRARDFDVGGLDQLVDEFDRFEATYFGTVDADEDERSLADRAYPMCVDDVSGSSPVRIPYTFAAVLGMTDDSDLRATMARRSGHLPEDAAPESVSLALARVEKAREWAVRTDNEYNYRLAESLPAVDPTPEAAAALEDLADFVEREAPDGETLQGEIYETARGHGVGVGDFFELGYRLFLDEPEGPRLGPFLAALDRRFVLRRLRREG